MKKIFSILLVLLFVTSLSLPAYAAGNAKPIVNVYKYNDASGKYDITASDATQGDLLLVQVVFDQEVESIASLRLKLEFPKDKVTFMENSFTPELLSSAQLEDYIFSAKDDYLIAFFGKSILTDGADGAEIAKDATKIASFIFRCDGYEGNVDFKATIDGVLDKNYGDVALMAESATTSVPLTSWVMSDEERAVFEQLQTITYAPGKDGDSRAAIEAADKIYNSYTAAEKLMFKNKEAKLYEYYKNAWTKYYDGSIEASKAALQAEVDRFIEENAEALSITGPEGVTESNYQSVLDAIDDYGKLTSRAQVMALDEKAKLDELEPAAEKFKVQKDADAFAKEFFVDAYEDTLWNLEPSIVNEENYADLMVMVEEALSSYGILEHNNLSETMKETVATYHEKLVALSDKIDEVTKAVGEDESIREEIATFTDKWHVVTRLTPLTVGVDDKTAIEMMLADYEKLSETAKKRLESRKTMAEQLLGLLEGYDEMQDAAGGNTGIQVVPQGGTTQEVIKEILKEVPVETLLTQIMNHQILRNVPTIVYVAILLMGLAVLTLPIPIVLYVLYRRKKNKMKGDSTV